MKIALICSHGGHLTELLSLTPAFVDHDTFIVTYATKRTENLEGKKYFLDNIGTNPIKMMRAFFSLWNILLEEKPQVLISTGSEIAIPAFIISKILRIKTIYIESWCRVYTKSGTGKILYFISDRFLVQWPELAHLYGKKARYEGSIM
jgi:beta-1,4-N-acetylglucosaminyltransferase